jgi:hypothetical protein
MIGTKLYKNMPPENIKLGKFKASRIIVKESWNALKQDKEVMWFPVISGFFTLLIIGAMASFFYFNLLGGSRTEFKIDESKEITNLVLYGTLFVYYIVIFFIVNFFQSALFIIVQGRFSGQDLNFSDGINGASKHIGKIFIWSFISATVGIVLKIISENFKVVGRIIAGVLGAAWDILTYFSLPALVIGNLNVKDSFKESAAIIKKTWGETLIVNFGVGLFFVVVIVLAVLLSLAIIIFSPTTYTFIIVGVIFAVFYIAMMLLSTTLSSIFKLALFNYARTGTIPQGFSDDIFKQAIK